MLTPTLSRVRRLGWSRILAAGLVILLAAEGIILATRWPFTRERALRGLGGAVGSEAQAGQFTLMFFPYPGCVMRDVAFRRGSGPGATPLATIRTLTVEGSWPALLTFTRRARLIRAEGLHVRLPADVPPASPAGASNGPETVISDLVADGAVLEIARHDPGTSALRLEFPQVTISEFAKKTRARFRAVVRHPEPPGDLRVNGTFGPWSSGEPGRTPLSGSFQFARADLGHYKGVAGTLSSSGSFDGPLAQVAVRGRAEVSGFAVNDSPYTLPLQADYRARVNGLTGDVLLDDVQARFRDTVLTAHGSVAAIVGQRDKTVSLEIDGRKARIDDLLRVFTKAEHPALSGPMVLQARIVLPPGDTAFIRRVQLDGDFRIDNARFTKARTQGKLDALSARARGEEIDEEDGERADRVVSDLSGRAVLRNGVARLSAVSFRVPGALAQGQGTYDLRTKHVDLYGTLAMQASLSDAAGGWKSILLKPLNAFFRRERAGAVVPVSLTGIYPRARFQVQLTGKK